MFVVSSPALTPRPQALLAFLFIAFLGTAWGQLPLDTSPEPAADPAAEAVPDPASLQPGWWRYISGAPPGAQDTRVEALVAAAETAVLSLRVEDVADAGEQIERLRAQLDALVRLQTQASQGVLPALRMEGGFSPEQFFDVIREQLTYERLIEAESAEFEERQDVLDRERRQLDSDFAAYLELEHGSTERLRLGLRVMARRAAVAVLEVRLQRLELRLENTRVFRDDLGVQLEYAMENVAIDVEDRAEVVAEVEAAGRAIEGARAAFATAEARLLQVAEDTARGRAEARVLTQGLTAALIQEARATLERLVAEVKLAWIDLVVDEGVPPELNAAIGGWRDELLGLEEKLDTWRSSATGVLLTPRAIDEGEEDPEISALHDRARARAQENLQQVVAIEGSVVGIRLLLEQLDEALAEKQGGFRRWLTQTRLTSQELYEGAVDLLKTRLFNIGETPVTPGGLLRVLIILLVAYWISTAVSHALERLGQARSFMNQSSIYTLSRLIHYVLMIGALLVALGSLGLDFSNLAIIAGALSVGIGFGLQSIVGNFVSGLILLFERSLKVGDYVQLDNGLRGHVREINIRSTRINTNDNIDVLVPNSEFVSKEVVNWTLRENMARMRIRFGVAYGTDKELVRRIGIEAADRVDFTLKNMPGKDPEVWFVNFGDSSLDFELLVWVSRSGVRRPGRVQATYLWELHTLFEEHGIEVPFPQRDLHVRTGLDAFVDGGSGKSGGDEAA
ncbi:MAG: mechanosensitive ion channel domain-containing protein [Pseudomonadota bacterium]